VNVQAADITGFGHQVSGYVRAFQPMTREGVLPFLAEDDAIPNSHYILIRQFLGSP
jgi:hypothetical protein